MINKVILVGNVGKDPEVRHLDNGTAYARFTLATSETYKDKSSGNKVTNTEWHNIVLWRGLADVAERFVKKGSKLYIEGKITSRSYDDPNGGGTKYFTEIVGNVMQMLDSKGSNDNSGQNTPPPPKQEGADNNQASEPLETDDLPF